MDSHTEHPKGMIEFDTEHREKIVEAAVILENETNHGANISIVKFDDFEKYIDDNKDKKRHRAIIEVHGHYMAVDILNNDTPKTCILLDAASDPRYYAALSLLENNYGYKVLSPCGFFHGEDDTSLQKDTSSCSMFAFDHCVQLSYAPDSLHTELMSKLDPEQADTFTWDKMPPNFIWNMQSLSILKKYQELYPDRVNEITPYKGYTLEKYVQEGRGISDGLHPVPVNDSINKHVFNKAFGSLTVLNSLDFNDELITEREDLLDEDFESDEEEIRATEHPSASAMREKVREMREEIAVDNNKDEEDSHQKKLGW